VRLVVTDNGRGFDTATPRRREQRGLTNLRARAQAAGGTLAISSNVGVGTRIEAELPIEEST
jgi:signal transduction histidine kinase